MKMKIFSIPALLSLGLMLGGCAGTLKPLPDGRYISAVNVGNLDRSGTLFQILEKVGTGEDGKPIFKQTASDLTVGPTVVGNSITGMVAGTVPALLQGAAAIRTANIKTKAMKCPEGTANCYSTVIGVGGAQAAAGSNSASQSGVAFDAVFQTGSCPSGNCLAIPTD